MDRKRRSLTPFHLLSKSGKWKRLQEDIDTISSDEDIIDFSSVSSNIGTDHSLINLHSKSESTESSSNDDEFERFENSEDNTIENYFCLQSSSDESEQLPGPSSSIKNDIETNDNSPENPSDKVKSFLRSWALTENISHASLSSLCKGLKSAHPQCFSDLPVDARTVLKTPRSDLNIVSIPPGEYFHVGLKKQLQLLLSLLTVIPTILHLMFNVDGLPLYKSSRNELWPISMQVPSLSALKNKVFPIGIYYGAGKPHDLKLFFDQFLKELVDLLDNGFVFDGQAITIKLMGFCCDAPAKAYILGIITHTGYFSCTRCQVEGETFEKRRIFVQTNCHPRSDLDFRQRIDKHYQPEERTTPLIHVPQLDFVKSFVLDYMHLVCLGVVRTLLTAWTFGPKPYLLPVQLRSSISKSLVDLRPHIPSEFVRRPRELKLLLRWKATEFRSFLMYFAPIVLKKLPSELYHHFLSLHIAISILLNPVYCSNEDMRNYSKSLLFHFVHCIPELYSHRFLTHNFHNLIHLVDDANHFSGILPNFSLNDISSFPFENYLQTFKKMARSYSKPLQQIARRITELFSSGHIQNMYKSCQSDYPSLKEPYQDGLLPPFCCGPQYKSAEFRNFKVSISSPDNCVCLKSGEILIVDNIAFSEVLKTQVIIGRKYLNKDDLYGNPLCASSNLGIYRNKWTVVKFDNDDEDDEFDSVPNCWFTSEKTILYPDKGKSTIKRLAKKSEMPEEDWLPLDVIAVQKDYDEFERSMVDVIRFQRGSRSLTASEAEEKGFGRRRPLKPMGIVTHNSESSDENTNLINFPKVPSEMAKKSELQKTQNLFQRKHQSSISSSSSQSSSKRSHDISAKRPKLLECTNAKKSHYCFLEEQPVTLESLAKGLCSLSKTVHSLQSKIKEFQMNYDCQRGSVGGIAERTAQLEFEDEEILDIKSKLPITSQRELQEFNNKLHEKQFFEKVVRILITDIEKSSLSKTARSVLRQTIDANLSKSYSWKGQQRKDQDSKKESFSSLMMAKLLRRCVEIVWPNEIDVTKKIEATVSTWLAQQASTCLKKEKNHDNYEDPKTCI